MGRIERKISDLIIEGAIDSSLGLPPGSVKVVRNVGRFAKKKLKRTVRKPKLF